MRNTRRPEDCSISVLAASNEVTPSGDLCPLHLNLLDTWTDLSVTSSWQEVCLEEEEWGHCQSFSVWLSTLAIRYNRSSPTPSTKQTEKCEYLTSQVREILDSSSITIIHWSSIFHIHHSRESSFPTQVHCSAIRIFSIIIIQYNTVNAAASTAQN